MPADLTKPFAESCCDGGSTTMGHNSTQPCGCDVGANHLCSQHRLEEDLKEAKDKRHFWLKRIRVDNLTDLEFKMFNADYEWSKS